MLGNIITRTLDKDYSLMVHPFIFIVYRVCVTQMWMPISIKRKK